VRPRERILVALGATALALALTACAAPNPSASGGASMVVARIRGLLRDGVPTVGDPRLREVLRLPGQLHPRIVHGHGGQVEGPAVQPADRRGAGG